MCHPVAVEPAALSQASIGGVADLEACMDEIKYTTLSGAGVNVNIPSLDAVKELNEEVKELLGRIKGFEDGRVATSYFTPWHLKVDDRLGALEAWTNGQALGVRPLAAEGERVGVCLTKAQWECVARVMYRASLPIHKALREQLDA